MSSKKSCRSIVNLRAFINPSLRLRIDRKFPQTVSYIIFIHGLLFFRADHPLHVIRIGVRRELRGCSKPADSNPAKLKPPKYSLTLSRSCLYMSPGDEFDLIFSLRRKAEASCAPKNTGPGGSSLIS